MPKLKAVFIRHKLSSTPEILEDLWLKRLIAVHYADISSTNPEDYQKSGKDALKRLWRYCEDGAVVGATFTSIRPIDILVGEIKPGSKIQVTKYGDLVYKTAQLENTREISLRDHPLLGAIQPRQATITGWPSAQEYLLAVLRGEKIPRKVKSLAPSQLEVICYEYLRLTKVLKVLLLPIGRTLPNIDIYGLNECGENIIAQVTQSRKSKEIQNKVNSLKIYGADTTKLIFFGPENQRVNDQQIDYISVEKVFAEIDAKYPQLIARMLNL